MLSHRHSHVKPAHKAKGSWLQAKNVLRDKKASASERAFGVTMRKPYRFGWFLRQIGPGIGHALAAFNEFNA
jgi:hypothetical protein